MSGEQVKASQFPLVALVPGTSVVALVNGELARVDADELGGVGSLAPYATATALRADLENVAIGSTVYTADRQFPWRVVTIGSHVHDGGITVAAASSPTRAAVLDFTGPIDVRWYGAAVGASAATNAAMIQAAINTAAANSLGVHIPISLSMTVIRIKNGLKSLTMSGGTITAAPLGSFAAGVIEFDGIFWTTTSVDGCLISGLKIDCAAVSYGGIFMASAQNCEVEDLKITGVPLGAPGVQLHYGSAKNRIHDFDITLSVGSNCQGVYVTGEADPDGGWAGGSFDSPLQAPTQNEIYDGVIRNGSHGVVLYCAYRNSVHDVTCIGQQDRSFIVGPLSKKNRITDCSALDYGSSGVHLAYGCEQNYIANVTCDSESATGEAGIQAYVGCKYNSFVDCDINGSSRYGYYFAIDAIGNRVKGGTINGALVQLAAMAIESDWADTPPGAAIYARPNYGAPTAPRTNWPNGDSYGNTFEGVTTENLGITKAHIVLTQLGAVGKLKRNTFKNCESVSHDGTTLPSYELYVYEETSTWNTQNKLIGNVFAGLNPAAIYFTRDRSHFEEVAGNSLLNHNTTFVDAADGDTSPSVASSDDISTAANTSPTLVAAFDGGINGQTIRVRLSAFTTIVHSGTLILRGSVNLVATTSNEFVTLARHGGSWFEISRTAA